MKVESVNIGHKNSLNISGKEVETGIIKQPVAHKVAITAHGLAGDTIVNVAAHGGLDQAVYLYQAEDYAWWSQQLHIDLEPGLFGENITVSGLQQQPWKVGDRLKINDLVLEISAPRIPCLKLATRMNDPTFAKQFIKALRPGAYARVIEAGECAAGDDIAYIPTLSDYVSIKEVLIQYTAKKPSKATLEKILASPISSLQRPTLEKAFLHAVD